MFSTLKVFGLDLAIDGGGSIAAPASGNLKVRNWSASTTQTEARLDGWIEIAARYTVRFVMRLAIEPGPAASTAVPSHLQNLPFPGTAFGLWDQLFATPSAGAALTVKLGGIRYLSSTFPNNGLGANSGTLLITGQQLQLLADSGLPMSIFTGPGGLELNLAIPSVKFRQGTFRQRTSYGLNVDLGGGDMGVLELLGRPATSHELTVQLNSAITPLVLLFEPDSTDPMPLHVDLQDRSQTQSGGNRVQVPLAVQNHLLQFTMGAAGDQAVLNGLSLKPKNGTLNLFAYAYSDKKNQPAQLQSGGELQLVSRIGEDGRPSALMVRAAYPNGQPLAAQPANDAAWHGLLQKSRFSLDNAINVHCATDVNSTLTLPPSLHIDVVRELTLPWFQSTGVNSGLTLARPGDSHRAMADAATGLLDASGIVQSLQFRNGSIALPLLTPALLKNNFPSEAKQHYNDLDSAISGLSYTLQSVAHETHLTETPSASTPTVQPLSIIAPQLGTGAVQLHDYTVSRGYGPVTLELNLPKGQDLDYFVITPENVQAIIKKFTDFNLVAASNLFKTGASQPGSQPSKQKAGRPAGIAKFSTKYSLADIFGKENIASWTVAGKDLLTELLLPVLRDKGWMGLILFEAPVVPDKNQTAGSLIPGDINLTYLAITPQKPGQNDAFSVTARMIWQNTDPAAGTMAATQESLFRLNELDVVWQDRRLASFYANAMLRVHSFFGVQRGQPADITIIGSYDAATDAITFLGRLPSPRPLLPEPPDDPGFGPIRQAYVRSASIKIIEGKTTIELDGAIDLASTDFAGGLFQTQKGRQIEFSSLRVTIPDPKDKTWQGLQIGYPSIKLNFDLPPFNLGFLAAKMNSLWVDWPDPTSGRRAFDFGAIVPLKAPSFSGPSFIFDLQLDLMKLPELALKGLDRLSLDFYIGLGLGDAGGGLRRWLPGNLSVGLRALGFDKLHLDLLRFLEITADSVKFDSVDQTDSSGAVTHVPCLALQNVAIKILGRTIISDLTAYLFSQPDGQACFAIFSAQKVTAGPITVRWVMVGHNISLDKNLAITMMEVGASADGADADLVKAIDDANSKKNFKPGTEVNQGRWIFAAAFSFAGLLDGKFLFQDQAYYGIALGGGIFKEWFGYDFAISVLYIKGRDPGQDAFVISLRVPQITLPAFDFMGGELSLNIALNGSFVLDIGFPHLNPNGSRQWERALGAIVTPYQGSGGFYIQKYTVFVPVKPQATDKESGLLISAGYAVQIGLGGSFGGGVFTAWVTAGIFFIVEGSVYLRNGNIAALRLAGAVGIVIRGGARLNFWIISVSIEIMLSAEARAVLAWSAMPEEYKLIGGDDSVGPNKVQLTLDLTLYASASAEACIGGGWFRLCKSISVSIPLRYQMALELN
jgi:hypothetical protein